MHKAVVYVMSGPAHIPYFLVSLRSLREVYDGAVVVYAWSESFEYLQEAVADERLRFSLVRREPDYRGKNAQFLDKIKVVQSLKEARKVLYLDADTMVKKPIDHLFDVTNLNGFTATQFCDWTTNGGTIKKRISNLIDRQPIDQKSVQALLENPLPSVNGGIWCADPHSAVLTRWHEWTWAVRDLFIADETVLHALSVGFELQNINVIRGGYFNCSPKYKPSYITDDEVFIWHFHGDSNVRPQKSQKGFDLWWPEYQYIIAKDVGNYSRYRDEVVQSNKHLRKVEKELT